MDVATCIDFVSPAVHLPTIRARPSGSLRAEEEAAAAGHANTPTSLRALYGVNGTKGDASKKTKQAHGWAACSHLRPRACTSSR